MKYLLHLAASFGLVLLPSPAQDQATTLLVASQAAPVIVRATVMAASDPSPEWHRLQFRTDEVLKGTLGADFALLEPAGACCGRSLFALKIGDTCLMFLQRRGPTLHPLHGGRSVLPDSPALAAHVLALLQAQNDAHRATLLAASLEHAEPRIADDAAHALAVLPELALASEGRAAVIAALQHDVQFRRTRTAPLVDVLVRLHDAAMLDQVLPTYLSTPHGDQARLLQKGLRRCQPALVVDQLLPHIDNQEQTAVRAAQLLGQLPPAEARLGLQLMLSRTRSPRVQLHLLEGLLATGMRSTELATQMQGAIPQPVLQLAQARHEQPGRFRSIDPRRR